jgi:putative membrane protein
MGFDGGMMGDWNTLGWLWMLIPLLLGGGLLALIVWAISRAFPGNRNNERREPRRESAEDILRERFARGEIDTGEYESSLRTLRGENTRESGSKVER